MGTTRRFGVTAFVIAMVATTAVVASPATTALATFSELGPKCADSGLLGVQINGAAPLGTYNLTGLPGQTVKITKTTGKVFDWTSTFGLERVIVQSIAGSKTYTYVDGKSGTGLKAPTLFGSNTTIASVRFCYDGRDTPTTSASTGTVEGARGVAISDIPLTSLPASLLNQVAGADLVNDAGTGLRFSGTSLRFSGTGLRFSGTGLRYSGTGLRFSPTPEVAGTGLRYSGTSLRFSGTSLRFSGTGLRFSGTGLRFSGDGVGTLVTVRSAGTGLRFSGTGLRFSGDGLALAETPAWNVPLSELQPPAGYSWNDVFVAIGEYEDVPPQNVTLGQLLDVLDTLNYVPPAVAPAVINALSTMSLLDLDPTGNVLRNVSLVGLLLGNTRLVDIPLPAGPDWCTIIDPEFTGTCATTDIGDATVLDLNLAGLRSDNLPLDGIPLADISLDPESVLAGLLANAPTFDSNNDGVVNGNDFNDGLYVPAQAGDTLASYLVRGIDALNVPWEQLPLSTTFDVRQFALGAPVTFTSSWSQVGTGSTDVVVTAPTTGFVLAQGSPTCTTTAGTCNVTQNGTTFRVQPSGSGFQTVDLRVAYRPSGLVGAGAPASGSFSVKAGSAGVQSFTVGVTDPWSASTPPSLDPDVLYFGTADRGEIDTYDVDVSDYAPGSHVAVRLSNLTDDADLVLYRDAGTSLRFSGTGMRFSGTGLRYSGTGLRYSGGSGDESVENRASETLEDVPVNPALLVEDVSATRAATPEAAEAFTDPDTSKFQVQVSGFNQATTDYVVRVAVTTFGGEDCTPSGTTEPGASVLFDPNDSADTIVVYPQERFGADAGTIDAAVARLNAFWPGGIQVAKVSTSGPDWTQVEGACSVYAANAVAEDVAAALQAEAADGTVKHVMLIGGDDKLPMYRSPDTTLIANEANYASTVGGQNPLVSALETQNLLTDDIYGDDDPWPFLNRLYFTPDRAVGRLVESTADIVGQIDRFIGADGVMETGRSFTAGYDFLADAATEIDQNLAEVSTSQSSLVSESWDVSALNGGLSGGDDGASLKIASIQAHMDQGLLLSAAGNSQGANPAKDQIAGPSVIPSGVKGAVMFTAGCHAGLNQPYTNAERTDSWSKSFAGSGAAAVYLANTGYGYGLDRPIVAYSEELLANFSDLLELDGMTVGEASAYAKQQYFAGQIEIDPYDEKSQMQLTLYGVPMYSLTAPAPEPVVPAAETAGVTTFAAPFAADQPLIGPTETDPLTGLATATVGVDVEFETRSGADSTSYWAINQAVVTNGAVSVPAEAGLEASDGNPIQPKFTVDVTAPDAGLIARGAVIESLTSRDVNLDNPTIARAVIDNTSTEEPAASEGVIFPTAFVTVQTEQTPDGPRGKLIAVPAQYNSADENEQLLIETLGLRTYYAPADSSDVVRPLLGNVSAQGSATQVLFRASVSDPNDAAKGVFGSGVKRVLLQYFVNNTWYPVEMFPANVEGTEWSGGLPGIPGGGVFFVQAVDGAGNVAATANKGQNYELVGDAPLAVAVVTGEQQDDGWYVGPATIELQGSAVENPANTYTVVINDGPAQTYTGPIVVDTEGENSVEITGVGAPPIRLVVPVDLTAPSVELTTPIARLAAEGPGTSAPADVLVCEDPLGGSGLRDLDPASDAKCEVTPKQYMLTAPDGADEDELPDEIAGPFTLNTVRGQDVAGNQTIVQQSAVILSGIEGENGFYTSPVILGIIGDAVVDAAYSLDGGENFTPYTVPITIENGTNVIVRIGGERLEFGVEVDIDAPTIDPVSLPPGPLVIGLEYKVTCVFGDSAGSGLAAVTCGSVSAIPDGTDPFQLPGAFTPTTRSSVFEASAKDLAGNVTTVGTPYSAQEREAPTIVVTPQPGPYELGKSYDVTCDFSDTGGSGLAQVKCGSNTVTGIAAGIDSLLGVEGTFTPSTLGDNTVEVYATDGDGNRTTGDQTYTADDLQAPTVVVSVTPPGGTYTKNQIVSVRCAFADTGGSGLASVTCGQQKTLATPVDQETIDVQLDTSTTGTKTFNVSATDVAGNPLASPSPSFTYTVTEPLCDPRGDAAQAKGDIILCAAKVNSNGTATISITVDGTISNDGTQYRLRLATSPTSSGTQVKWAAGKITGTPLRSASVNPLNPSQLDLVIDLRKVGCALGATLYWSAEVQNGTKDPGVGFLDRAPNTGYFTLRT